MSPVRIIQTQCLQVRTTKPDPLPARILSGCLSARPQMLRDDRLTLTRQVQGTLVVIFAIKNLECVFPFILLRGLTDLQPGHLFAAPDPHMLTRCDLSISEKMKTSRNIFEVRISILCKTPVGQEPGCGWGASSNWTVLLLLVVD